MLLIQGLKKKYFRGIPLGLESVTRVPYSSYCIYLLYPAMCKRLKYLVLQFFCILSSFAQDVTAVGSLFFFSFSVIEKPILQFEVNVCFS